MAKNNDKDVLIRAMREYMREDNDLIEDLDQKLCDAIAQRDEALDRIDALVDEVEQWKRIALDVSSYETE